MATEVPSAGLHTLNHRAGILSPPSDQALRAISARARRTQDASSV